MASKLTKWDQNLIDKYLPRYQKLEAGTVKPSSLKEEHFVAVFKKGNQPIKTQHEIAYSRYKEMNKKFEKQGLKKSSLISKDVCKEKQNKYLELEKHIDTLDDIIIKPNTNKETREYATQLCRFWKIHSSNMNNKIADVAVWLNFLTESNLSKSLERLSAENFNTLSNEITKSLDGAFAEGLRSGADYISPSLHRLIEAGHTLPEAFKRGREALDSDSIIQELWGTSEALLSDMSSVVGLPIINISKDTTNQILEWTEPLGIDEKKFADLLSYNTIELAASIIPIIAVMFSWNTTDVKKFTELVGTLAITTAYAGNPFGLAIVLVGLGRSYHQSKKGEFATKYWLKSLSKGGLISSAILISMSFIGPVLWTSMVTTLVIAKIMSINGFHIDWKKLASLMKYQFDGVVKKPNL